MSRKVASERAPASSPTSKRGHKFRTVSDTLVFLIKQHIIAVNIKDFYEQLLDRYRGAKREVEQRGHSTWALFEEASAVFGGTTK